MRFKEKVVIITGAAGAGIGQASARAFAKEGAKVVVGDANGKRALKIAEDITSSSGAETLGIGCDVSDKQQVQNMVKETLDKFGKVDILVNNAARQRSVYIEEMPDEIWEETIKICLYGTFYCSRAVLPTMIKQGYGRIINFASVVALTGTVDGDTHYAAAKAGIVAFTKGLSREVAKHSITVNCVCPGFIWNEFLAKIGYPQDYFDEMMKKIPMGRSGKPEEAAALVLFLASDEASYLTGDTITVSGGWVTL